MLSHASQLSIVGTETLIGQKIGEIINESPTILKKAERFTLLVEKGTKTESVQKKIRFQIPEVKELSPDVFKSGDIILFAGTVQTTRDWAEIAAEQGAWVIDLSEVFSLDSDILLSVPEVNGSALRRRLDDRRGGALIPSRSQILSSPNSISTALALVLKPLQENFGLKGFSVSTYQSSSSVSDAALIELLEQRRDWADGRNLVSKTSPYVQFENVLPQVGEFEEDLSTDFEKRVTQEVKKLLSQSDLKASITAARVPISFGDAISLSVGLERSASADHVRDVLSGHPGVFLQDHPEKSRFPVLFSGNRSQVEAVLGKNWIGVGRIRPDETRENGLNLWVVSDSLRKGAAWNAIQIAEILFQNL